MPHVAVMRRLVPLLLAAIFVVACAHARHASNVQPSPQGSGAPNASPTPAYNDLQGVAALPYIDDLTQLQVFWPPGGPFEPNKPVLRREFARWLQHADAAIWAQNPSVAIRPAAPDARAYFTDVPPQDPDFTAIEGLHDAGVVLAPDKKFSPNLPITREDALAIKAYVDCGAPDPLLAGDTKQAYFELPAWRDRSQISTRDAAAIATCLLQDQGTIPANRLDTIDRTFGTITALDPRRPLTRAEAAALIWKIGEQKPDLSNFPPRSAAEALAGGSP